MTTRRLARADLHVHTRFSRWRHLGACNARDSYNEPLAVYDRLRSAGMDFVAYTDHDTIDGALDLLSRRPELESRVIIGEEVETWFPETKQWLHINVFGIDEAAHRDIQALAPDVRELVAWLRARGILHVLNHPFQSFRLQTPAAGFIEEILGLFDHFEVANAALSARHNMVVGEMLDHARRLGLRRHGVGGSDAHVLRHLAASRTAAPVEMSAKGIPCKRSFLEAVARGEARPEGGSVGVAALTAAAYRIIGRYYMQFAAPGTRREMRPLNWAAAGTLIPAVLAGFPAFITLGNQLRLEAILLHVRRELRHLESRGEEMALPDPVGDPPG